MKINIFLTVSLLTLISSQLYSQEPAPAVQTERQNTIAAARYLKSVLKIDEAIDTLSTLLGPNYDEEVLSELADCHYQNGNYEGAAGMYFMLASQRPANLLYKVRQVVVLYRMKAYQQAAETGKAVLEMDEIPSVSSMVGDCYNQLEQQDSALVYYGRSLQYRPVNENVVSKAAKIYLGRKDYDSALALSDAFLQLDSNNFTIAPVKGLAHFLKGEYEPAIEVFENQLKLENDNYGVHYYLGQCYWQTRVMYRAEEELKKAWQIDSSDVNLAFSIAGVKSDASRPFEEVSPWLDKALEMLEPDREALARVHQQYGLGYYRKMDAWDEAIFHYSKAYENDPNLKTCLSTIAYCYEQKKDYKSALKWYERFLELAKPGSNAYNFAKQNADYIRAELFMEEK